MRKKGKLLGLILCIAAFSVFALGSGSSAESNTEKEITSVEKKDVVSDSTTSDVAAEESDKSDTSSEATTTDTGADVSIEEQVVLEQDNIKITATEMKKGILGPELKLLVENDTDKGLTFQIRNANVNGYMVDTMMSEDVAAGKKSNTEVTFTTNGLEECGIKTFANIEFSFHIFDSESWDTVLDSDVIKLETSAASSHVQEYDDSGEVFYDQDGIKIIGKGLSTNDSVFGPGLIVYIENNSNKDFTVQVRDTSVNGFMIDTSMSTDVLVGKKAITAVTFFSTSLEDNGITDIESIETSFHVFDMASWDTIVDTEPITINF